MILYCHPRVSMAIRIRLSVFVVWIPTSSSARCTPFLTQCFISGVLRAVLIVPWICEISKLTTFFFQSEFGGLSQLIFFVYFFIGATVSPRRIGKIVSRTTFIISFDFGSSAFPFSSGNSGWCNARCGILPIVTHLFSEHKKSPKDGGIFCTRRLPN